MKLARLWRVKVVRVGPFTTPLFDWCPHLTAAWQNPSGRIYMMPRRNQRCANALGVESRVGIYVVPARRATARSSTSVLYTWGTCLGAFTPLPTRVSSAAPCSQSPAIRILAIAISCPKVEKRSLLCPRTSVECSRAESYRTPPELTRS